MKKGIILIFAIFLIFFIVYSISFTLFYQKIDSISYTESINLAGEWFLNNQNNDFLCYEYNVKNKTCSESRHYLREVASLWSVALLSNITKEKKYEKLANKGFDYFESYFVYDKDDFYYLNITEDVKLGYSAFIILTLLEMSHEKKDFYLEKFAKGILKNQNDNGEIKTIFFSDKEESKDYYPGEALFALMSLYNSTPNPLYIDAVEKAFPYYRDYWRKKKNTAFVPWQSRAYYLLYKSTENQTLKEELKSFVFEMNDYMINYHNPENCSNFDFSRGIVTSVYLEGMIQAYKLAKETKDSREICYKNFILEGSNATLALQIKDNSYGRKAKGGFLGGANVFTQRVDRNQHSVIAFIEAKSLGLIS